MTKQEIEELQKSYNIQDIQNWINSGAAWKMEGNIGRKAMEYLSVGACFLPLKAHYDYWGNEYPSRTKVNPGSTGSLLNAKRFWTNKEKYSAYFSDDENAWGEYIMSQIEKRRNSKV